jgi:hypothetical protein
MALVKNVEKKIWDIEDFDVVIRGADGRDIRGDRTGIPMYPYDRAAKNDMTVAEWRDGRFTRTYPGLEVDVVDANGTTMTGNTKLATVRDTYLED